MGTPKIHNVSKSRLQEFGEAIKYSTEGQTVSVTTDDLTDYKHGTIEEKNDSEDGYYVMKVRLDCGETAQIYANWRDIPPSASDQQTPFLGFISCVSPAKNSKITDFSVE